MAVVKSLKFFINTVVCTVLAVTAIYASAAEPLRNVADLRYGVTLYEYYQDNYLEALTELMVAEQRGGIQGHGDNPNLMEGGISLAFGMERKAGDIFTRLLDERRPLEVRNAAWFYLGKLRYLRGDWSGAETALNNISGRFDKQLIAELASLQINLVIQRGDLPQATQLLNVAENHKLGTWLPYVYYNLGAAYSRSNDYETAIGLYTNLSLLPVMQDSYINEELLALNDKALTAAGYSHMLQGNYLEALDQFRQVRLESGLSNRALLGYGWAAAEVGDYALALQPWQTLTRRPLVHASAQEAILAVPYAFEKLGAAGQALNAFIQAQSVYEQEISRIDSVLQSLEEKSLLTALKVSEQSNRNWFSIEENMEVKPDLSYLTELFASNRFQGAVQELRDLVRMQRRLQQWQEKLSAYQLMLDEREIAREKKLTTINDRQLLQRAAVLRTYRDRLARRIDKIDSENDFIAIASPDTTSLFDIVKRAEQSITRLKAAGEDVAFYEEPLKRYRGLLLWQASENFSTHLWQNRKVLNELDTALAELTENQTRLEKVIVTAPDITPYRVRIAELEARIEKSLLSVDGAVMLAENSLRRQVAKSISEQRIRLRHYLAQARLSVARLYDTALQEQQP